MRYIVNGKRLFHTYNEALAYAEGIYKRTGAIVEIRAVSA